MRRFSRPVHSLVWLVGLAVASAGMLADSIARAQATSADLDGGPERDAGALLDVGTLPDGGPLAEPPFPPRSSWRASSSAATSPAMAPPMAIDGDTDTRWGGAFSAEQWLQIDLREVATVGGILLHWDSGFAASYRILVSETGREWQNVFETADGQGGIEYVFFAPVRARYVRLASMPLSADWGVSVLEIEPIAATEAPQLAGFDDAASAPGVWNGNATVARALTHAHVVHITLPRALPTTGLEVVWGGPWQWARLEARDERGRMRTLAVDRAPGDTSLLAAREPITAKSLRLVVAVPLGTTPSVRRLHLLPPDRTMTPLRRYEVAASRTQRELFPLNLRNRQVYWTTVGIPAGMQKSIFDEFGNLEAFKGAPMVQPLWRDAQGAIHAAHGASPAQTLREGWMPMPAVQWAVEDGLTMRSETMTVEQGGQPITLLRHRLANTSAREITGELLLLVRPAQINPSWQSGGIAPIRAIQFDGPPEQSALRVNGRLFFHALSPPHGRGTAAFGPRGEGEITQHLAAGTLPTARRATDEDGLAGAYLRYQMTLAPGAHEDVVLAFPLGVKHMDVQTNDLPEAPPVDRAALLGQAENAGASFDRLATQLAQKWGERVGRVGLVLPDHNLVDTLRAQVAYMLINQTGPAIHPGPRNYNRSFIRDGSATATIFLRMGLPEIARDYLRWYTDHALHDNGLVSPILNENGTVNRGWGSDLEHDSQGQYVSFVADIAQLDGGPQTVRNYLPSIRLALRFLKQLRERTMVPGYLSEREAPERFHGLLAPSISHEGYSVPTHSYWDDFWGLKGWHDGIWLASSLGNADLSTFAKTEYDALKGSLMASMRATMAWKKIETIPSSADVGEYDPTSTSIGISPCGQQDVMPPDALDLTFDTYLDSVKKRAAPNSLWAYTPYEFRNVLTYVRLNRPSDAKVLFDSLYYYRRPQGWHVFAEVVHSRLRHPGYFGDMPHTWIGAEYVRTIFDMLMHEADDRLELLPGIPQEWVTGTGLSVSDLRTAYGRLTMKARHDGTQLSVELGPGVRPDAKVFVAWPLRLRPERVLVDGEARDDQTADGILLSKPFKQLVARW